MQIRAGRPLLRPPPGPPRPRPGPALIARAGTDFAPRSPGGPGGAGGSVGGSGEARRDGGPPVLQTPVAVEGRRGVVRGGARNRCAVAVPAAAPGMGTPSTLQCRRHPLPDGPRQPRARLCPRPGEGQALTPPAPQHPPPPRPAPPSHLRGGGGAAAARTPGAGGPPCSGAGCLGGCAPADRGPSGDNTLQGVFSPPSSFAVRGPAAQAPAPSGRRLPESTPEPGGSSGGLGPCCGAALGTRSSQLAMGGMEGLGASQKRGPCRDRGGWGTQSPC